MIKDLWWKIIIRLFGKRFVGIDIFDGIKCTITSFSYKGHTFITNVTFEDYNEEKKWQINHIK